ncbi:MAG: hypothetical protein HY717_07060 [Planctomycetes bacterium]|nr:hypothetical protein [Planctomycetota bacterium]
MASVSSQKSGKQAEFNLHKTPDISKIVHFNFGLFLPGWELPAKVP